MIVIWAAVSIYHGFGRAVVPFRANRTPSGSSSSAQKPRAVPRPRGTRKFKPRQGNTTPLPRTFAALLTHDRWLLFPVSSGRKQVQELIDGRSLQPLGVLAQSEYGLLL